jgi:hypothetical protein
MRLTDTEFKAKDLKVLGQGQQNDEFIRDAGIAIPTPAPRKAPWMALRGTGRMTGDPFAPVWGQ